MRHPLFTNAFQTVQPPSSSNETLVNAQYEQIDAATGETDELNGLLRNSGMPEFTSHQPKSPPLPQSPPPPPSSSSSPSPSPPLRKFVQPTERELSKLSVEQLRRLRRQIAMQIHPDRRDALPDQIAENTMGYCNQLIDAAIKRKSSPKT
ncbi:MAG: hypothetical protein ABJH63_17500 [Rhizobiaceae bacterium]